MTVEEIEEVKVHRPTYHPDGCVASAGRLTNNRKIIVDADESTHRMVTRSMTRANQIDFDGASRAWRKANPNRHR